jgi:hypothetical protein
MDKDYYHRGHKGRKSKRQGDIKGLRLDRKSRSEFYPEARAFDAVLVDPSLARL